MSKSHKPRAEAEVLERLFQIIESRKGASPDSSYTAKLFSKGLKKISQKLGEESAETIIAALVEDEDALAGESADLLYHLLVLWSARGLDPEKVWEKLAVSDEEAERFRRKLAEREGQSGLEEKAARSKGGK